MSLLPEHAKYHKLGPKDLGLDPDKKSAMTFDIARTTNNTGEQLHVTVPVYTDDSREELMNRINFAYSIMQERLEDENKAINWRNERGLKARQAGETIKRNTSHFEKKLKELQKSARKQNWNQETFIEKRDLLKGEFDKANAYANAILEHVHAELEAGHELPYTGPEESSFKETPATLALAEDLSDEEESPAP